MSRTVADWIEGLKSSDSNRVKEAVRALGYIGQDAVDALITALREDSVPFDHLEEAFKQTGKVAVEPLAVLLAESDTALQQKAAHLLGALRDNSAVLPLIVALENNPQVEVRAAIAAALEQFSDPRAVPPLLSVLQNDVNAVRAKAAKSLGAFARDPRVAGALLKAVQDTDPGVRGGAIQGMARISGDERVEAALTAAVEDADFDVRQLAAAALQYRRGDLMAFQRVQSNQESAVMHAAGEILRDGQMTEEDMELMRNSNPRVRARLLDMVTEDGKTAAFTLILPGLNDINPAVRKSAVDALVRLGAKVVPALTEVLHTHTSRFTRAGAANALGLIADVRAVPGLIQAMQDGEASVRANAVEALAHFPADEALIKALKAAARDEDKTVRETAEQVLKKFGHTPDKEGALSRFFRRLTGGGQP